MTFRALGQAKEAGNKPWGAQDPCVQGPETSKSAHLFSVKMNICSHQELSFRGLQLLTQSNGPGRAPGTDGLEGSTAGWRLSPSWACASLTCWSPELFLFSDTGWRFESNARSKGKYSDLRGGPVHHGQELPAEHVSGSRSFLGRYGFQMTSDFLSPLEFS